MIQLITEGVYLVENMPVPSQRWAIPALYNRRYWDVVTVEDEDELARYLAGQRSFVTETDRYERYEIPFGQEAKQARHAEPEHTCARCKRPCKARFVYCYRCHTYLKVKAKIA